MTRASNDMQMSIQSAARAIQIEKAQSALLLRGIIVGSSFLQSMIRRFRKVNLYGHKQSPETILRIHLTKCETDSKTSQSFCVDPNRQFYGSTNK